MLLDHPMLTTPHYSNLNGSSQNHDNMGVQTSTKVWKVTESLVSGLYKALFRQQVKQTPWQTETIVYRCRVTGSLEWPVEFWKFWSY